MGNLLYGDESFKIVGAALHVHTVLGCGFTEKVYQDALEIEFKKRGIPYEREKHLTIKYEGVTIDHDYYVDFLCYDKIIVELKSVVEVVPVFKAQVINYLKAGNFKLGYLFNFGETSLYKERFFLPNR